MCSHIDLSLVPRSWPRGIKRCLSVTPEREGEGEMRSDAIRSDPSHRTHRRRTLLKIITALGSLRSWGTLHSPSLSHSLSLAASLSLSHFVASTFIFSFIGLRFCLVCGGSVCFCVGISQSLYMAYIVNFLFPFALFCSFLRSI